MHFSPEKQQRNASRAPHNAKPIGFCPTCRRTVELAAAEGGSSPRCRECGHGVIVSRKSLLSAAQEAVKVWE